MAKSDNNLFNILKLIIVSIIKLNLIGFLQLFVQLIIKVVSFIGGASWWLAVAIYGVIVSGTKKAKQISDERDRPQMPAIFESFSEVESFYGKSADFEKELYSGKSLIGLVLGARGSGKTAVGVRILENIRAKTSTQVYSMGLARDSVPAWVKTVDNLDQVANHSFILVDEGGIEFSSRSFMSNANKLLSELLLISRHRDISVLFITQNSANIDINTIRQVDYILLKTPSLLQLDFERKKISEIYEQAKAGFEKYKQPGLTYIYAHNYKGFVVSSLPSFWSTNLSKSYAKKKL